MAVNNMKKKAQSGAAISNKFTIPKKLASIDSTLKKSKDTTKSFESNKFTIPKKMQTGGAVKKTIVKVPYPKDKNMSPADSASFRSGAGGSREGDGYTGITSNPYFQKGKEAFKNTVKPKKTMKSGGKMKKKC